VLSVIFGQSTVAATVTESGLKAVTELQTDKPVKTAIGFGPPKGLRFLGGTLTGVAEIDSISLHIAFRSPEGHDARSAENDWLRAGKRAMCVSIF
jgi:hypothetical protein